MSLRDSYLVLKHLGPRWAWFRSRYAFERRLGVLRRKTPVASWNQIPAVALRPLGCFTGPVSVGSEAVADADEILNGTFRLFSCHRAAFGNFPDWAKNPLRPQHSAPADRHWSVIGDFASGDIKGIWELSRLPWAFALARAYKATGEERYAERFWSLFEHWLQHNPPNIGPNWMCGQEATFRLIAATFAAEVFFPAKATTVLRREALARFVLATGWRICANIGYAVSQSNNHGISECVGLITAAALLPERPESAAWHDRGMRSLHRQLVELVYPDGGFAQHSAIYHRVLLHDLLWCRAVLATGVAPIPQWLCLAGRQATGLLAALVNDATGAVPLYGASDGANILPLSDSEYLDFRPVVQAGAVAFFGERRFFAGPWDEAGEWLVREKPPAATPGKPSSGGTIVASQPASPAGARYFPQAGCLWWQSGETHLFLRCPTRFRHRPSHDDLLHVDVEWRGQQIALDAGTYSYADDQHPAGALSAAEVHNTVTLDAREPMTKVGRFLYVPWPKGRAVWDRDRTHFEATHDGWQRFGVAHARTISAIRDDGFLVEDLLRGCGTHIARLHWLLADLPHRLDLARNSIVLTTAAGDYSLVWQTPTARISLVRADEGTARGWWAPSYFHAAPALSLAIEFEFRDEARVSTRFTAATG